MALNSTLTRLIASILDAGTLIVRTARSLELKNATNAFQASPLTLIRTQLSHAGHGSAQTLAARTVHQTSLYARLARLGSGVTLRQRLVAMQPAWSPTVASATQKDPTTAISVKAPLSLT